MPQQQQFASVPSPLACPSASQTNASCQPLTDRRPSTNMPRVLDTFLMPGGLCKGGLICACCTTAQLGGGGCMGAAGACKKKKESYETRDVLGPACVMGGVDAGWGGSALRALCLAAAGCRRCVRRPARMGWDERSCSGHVFGGDGTMVLLVSGGGSGGRSRLGVIFFSVCRVSSVDCHCSEGWMYTGEKRYIQRLTGPFFFSPTTPRWFSFPTDPIGSMTGTRQDPRGPPPDGAMESSPDG